MSLLSWHVYMRDGFTYLSTGTCRYHNSSDLFHSHSERIWRGTTTHARLCINRRAGAREAFAKGIAPHMRMGVSVDRNVGDKRSFSEHFIDARTYMHKCKQRISYFPCNHSNPCIFCHPTIISSFVDNIKIATFHGSNVHPGYVRMQYFVRRSTYVSFRPFWGMCGENSCHVFLLLFIWYFGFPSSRCFAEVACLHVPRALACGGFPSFFSFLIGGFHCFFL
jgi:hypothetical protein